MTPGNLHVDVVDLCVGRKKVVRELFNSLGISVVSHPDSRNNTKLKTALWVGLIALDYPLSGGNANLVTKLEETLELGRWVFGSASLVAMGKKTHQAGLSVPLLFAAAQELVNDNLRSQCLICITGGQNRHNWQQTCAPLAKSPNWASQRTSWLGCSREYPSSNPGKSIAINTWQ